MVQSANTLFAAMLVAMLGLAASAPAQTPGADTTSPSAEAESAKESWVSIRGSSNPADFEDFLQRYPDHDFASFARAKLNSLRPQAVALPQSGQQPTATPQDRQAVVTPPDSPESIIADPAATPLAPTPDLAVNMQLALQEIGCYGGGIDGDWGRGSQAAVQRFNALAGSNLPVNAPTQEALASVTSWGGGNCPAIAKRAAPKAAKKKRASKTRKKKTAASSKTKRSSGGSGMRVIIGGGGVGVGIGF